MKYMFRIAATSVVAAFLFAGCNGGGHGVIPAPGGKASSFKGHVGMHVAMHANKTSVGRHRMDASNSIADPGFESGAFGSWSACGNGLATFDTTAPHSGTYDAFVGNLASNPGEETGMDGVCQTVTVPASGALTLWVNESTSETSTNVADQEGDILDSSGNVTATLFIEDGNTNGYVQKTIDMSSYAGQSVTLFFGIYGSGSTTDYNNIFIDDVSLTGSSATATPGSTPTPASTPTPSGGATPFPTPPGSGPNGTSCGISCGVQRWHIKTLDDGDEHLINWNPVVDTVSDLAAIPVPSGYQQYNDTTRYAPTETQVYTVRAVLVGWKTESDNDFHIVIADPNNPSSTMIVEPPDSACSMACDSGFGPTFDAVRSKLTSCFGQPTGSFTRFSQTIVADFTGVPLFDALHGQTGVAPNGIELHPLLDVSFVSGGC